MNGIVLPSFRSFATVATRPAKMPNSALRRGSTLVAFVSMFMISRFTRHIVSGAAGSAGTRASCLSSAGGFSETTSGFSAGFSTGFLASGFFWASGFASDFFFGTG